MRFEPSLFDKLFESHSPRANQSTIRTLSLDEIKVSVARDLESLLNTRMGFSEARMAPFRECAGSMLTYGLNDFSGRSLASSDDREFICESIQRVIAHHEPRLSDVEVTLALRGQSEPASGLNFAIKAMLVLHPAQALVNFDAMLQPSIHRYCVTRARGKA
jgi:type VI secretion system protein ImpF